MPVAMTIVTALVWQSGARAADDAETPRAPTGNAEGDTRAPAVSEASEPVAATAAAAPLQPPTSNKAWGVGLRTRVVSVPSWLLGLFTAHNHRLLTFGHFGVEGFRRGGNFDVGVAFAYQNMSPPDGNWLATDHHPEVDTKFVQFRGLSLYSIDFSVVWHPMFTSWFGAHVGGGVGLAIVRGDLFLFNSEGCNSGNLDNLSQCHPMNFVCANGVCTAPPTQSRTPNKDVLPVVPIFNVVLGVDFRLPNVRGWEARIEGGFYDAFFGGLAVAYTF